MKPTERGEMLTVLIQPPPISDNTVKVEDNCVHKSDATVHLSLTSSGQWPAAWFKPPTRKQGKHTASHLPEWIQTAIVETQP